jgi:ABC-2 type transport system permease protein
MRLKRAWTIASKDFLTFRRKSLIYSLTGFQVLVGIGLPSIIAGKSGDIPVAMLPGVLNSFSFWFAIGATIIPLGIASYSLIGEKIQKSLEPLLATPVTDNELLMGKSIAAFVPTIIATYIGAVVFMLLMDVFTRDRLNYLYYPNWFMAIMMLLFVPLACILSIEVNVLISSRFSDLRSAQSFAMLTLLPFPTVYVLSEIGIFPLTMDSLLILSTILFVLDLVVFYATKSTFQREEILTKWK